VSTTTPPERTAVAGALREAAHMLWPPPTDGYGPLKPMLVALTFLTGVVDATSYLRFGHVFVANMTGNLVFLGFGLGGGSGLSPSFSLVALGSVLVGALAGGRIGATIPDHRGRLLRAASAVQLTLLAIALIVALLASEPPHTGVVYALIVSMSLAMGVQNATAQRLAVPELTTTVLTRTLTGVASESRLAGGPGSKLGARSVAVAAMLLGAITGALLVTHVTIVAALAVASAIALGVCLAAHLVSRGEGPWA
jgi:uncharacterized membrane protein YoaK (UPF0700 family)